MCVCMCEGGCVRVCVVHVCVVHMCVTTLMMDAVLLQVTLQLHSELTRLLRYSDLILD